LDLLLFALLLGGPGIVFGMVSGALLWRAHRIVGGLLGGLAGWAVGIGLFAVWSDSTLSRDTDYAEAMLWMALLWLLPGLCGGAAIGWAVQRTRRAIWGVRGGVIGALAGVAGWVCFAAAV
jgi:hypothetical protein